MKEELMKPYETVSQPAELTGGQRAAEEVIRLRDEKTELGARLRSLNIANSESYNMFISYFYARSDLYILLCPYVCLCASL